MSIHPLEDYCHQRGITVSKLARMAKISAIPIVRCIKGGTLSYKTAKAIHIACEEKVPLECIFKIEGINLPQIKDGQIKNVSQK